MNALGFSISRRRKRLFCSLFSGSNATFAIYFGNPISQSSTRFSVLLRCRQQVWLIFSFCFCFGLLSVTRISLHFRSSWNRVSFKQAFRLAGPCLKTVLSRQQGGTLNKVGFFLFFHIYYVISGMLRRCFYRNSFTVRRILNWRFGLRSFVRMNSRQTTVQNSCHYGIELIFVKHIYYGKIEKTNIKLLCIYQMI